MSETQLSGGGAIPRIHAGALLTDLAHSARIGGNDQGGICRLTLSDSDAQIRAWLSAEITALGGEVSTDQIGNLFGHFAGEDPSLPPIGFGSHLDTQPTGGRFDGILGVLGGLAALRALKAAGVKTRHPLCLVNWTNEEGARYAPTMLGSGVHAGIYDLQAMRAVRDKDGISLGQALDAIAAASPLEPGATELGAWLELHIEQGPVLERRALRAASVTGVQGLRWFELVLHGRAAHAGTTPREDRSDALLASACLMLALEAMAKAEGGLVTFGEIAVTDASRNVVPGEVRLSVDFRHTTPEGLDRMEAGLRQLLPTGPVSASLTPVFGNQPVAFDARACAAVATALAMEGLPAFEMISGAGHDAVNLAPLMPTAMIFVPSKDGLSHNPAEFTADEDCVLGAQLLLNAIITLDRQL